MSSMPQMLLNYISPYHILSLALGTSLISSQDVQITKDILTQWGGVNFRAIKNIMRTRCTWRERNDHSFPWSPWMWETCRLMATLTHSVNQQEGNYLKDIQCQHTFNDMRQLVKGHQPPNRWYGQIENSEAASSLNTELITLVQSQSSVKPTDGIVSVSHAVCTQSCPMAKCCIPMIVQPVP